MKQFLQWFKDLVLPFENPDHPLYYDKEAEEAFQRACIEEILGCDSPY